MLGPTGCGKTFMVELLFQNILKLPTVIVDIASFTRDCGLYKRKLNPSIRPAGPLTFNLTRLARPFKQLTHHGRTLIFHPGRRSA
jgi:hypothetical protein